MDVIGNNIANVNTVAFKSTSVTFSDVMYQTTSKASGTNALTGTGGVNAKQIGLGSSTAAMKIDISTEGASQTTGSGLDMKISGDSFFVVSNGSENLFTRDGSFTIDGNGNLVMSSTGYNVMGWQVSVDDATGERTIVKDTVSALQVMSAANQVSAPEATTEATMSGIIDANSTSLSSDDGYITSLTFYDNLGYKYTAKFSLVNYETYTADNVTTQLALPDGVFLLSCTEILDSDGNTLLDSSGNALDSTNDNLASLFPSAYITFNDDTGLVESVDLASSSTVTATSATATVYSGITTSGATDLTLALFGAVDEDAGTYVPNLILDTVTSTGVALAENTDLADTTGVIDLTNTTSEDDTAADVYANMRFKNINIDLSSLYSYDNSGTSTAAMDRGDSSGDGAGWTVGTMTSLTTTSNGLIYGSYDNGTTLLLGQIAVANFTNPSGLESLGNNCYAETLNSGEFDGIGQDVSADGGSISTGVLEMSNVDLSSEFTNMITTQRGFQANSRIITTSDTLLEELINLKR
ncbi:MAG: flagellar hook-basal body complex protein [Eubacterium sp.]|nr:flagellar hook-basal body complex protein [Eubacterium sp.]